MQQKELTNRVYSLKNWYKNYSIENAQVLDAQVVSTIIVMSGKGLCMGNAWVLDAELVSTI